MRPRLIPYKGEDGLWYIDDVPIVETGIEYDLSTGPATFTEEDLIDAVLAYEDPVTVDPRIKLGHTSGFNASLMGDGEPAFGRVRNLYLGNNGQTVYGQYAGMPEWLAKILPVAYPNRSIDGKRNVTLVNARQYKMMITDVSNLGVFWPGCSSLEDLPLWFGDDIPAGVEIDMMEPEAVAAGGDMKLRRKKDKDEIAAAVDVDLVRRHFNREIAVGDDYWLWVRGVKLDEGYLIVEDEEEGRLFRYPVEASDSGEITFGDRVEVYEAFPDKVAASARNEAFVTGVSMLEPGMVIYASRAESRPEEDTTQEGASEMDEATRKAMASRLGLPEDATEEQIDTELERLKGAAVPDGSRTPKDGQQGSAATAPAADDAGTTGPTTSQPVNDPPSAPVATGPVTPAPDEPPIEAADGTVRLDRETFEQLKAGSALAVEQHKKERKREIDTLLASAKTEGKIMPSREAHYRTLLEQDFEGGKELIDQLAAGVVPVTLRGAPGSTTEQEGDLAASAGEGFPDDWFPDAAEARKRAASGGRVTMAKEG